MMHAKFAAWSAVLLFALCIGRHGSEGRSLRQQSCTSTSTSFASSQGDDASSVGQGVTEAFAKADGCGTQEAVAKTAITAKAKAIARAIARTSGTVEGDGCTEQAYAKAKAGAEAVAKAMAKAVATAVAEATNDNAQALNKAGAEAVETVIEKAVAKSESVVQGVGEAANEAVAEVIAEAIAEAVAEAIAVVECDGGSAGSSDKPETTGNDGKVVETGGEGDGSESGGSDGVREIGGGGGGPSAGPQSDSTAACRCSPDGFVNGVRTGRVGCKQHMLHSGDQGYFCMVVGGDGCPGAKPSGEYPGTYWRDC